MVFIIFVSKNYLINYLKIMNSLKYCLIIFLFSYTFVYEILEVFGQIQDESQGSGSGES